MNEERYPPEGPLEPLPPEEEEWNEEESGGETWPPPFEETAEEAFASPPSPEGPQPKSPRPGTPWDRRRELGFLEAFADSWRMLVFRPSTFFGELSPRGGFAEPLLFFVVFCLVLTVFSFPAELCANYLQQWMARGTLQWYQNLLSRAGAPAELQQLYERVLQQPAHWTDILLGQLCCMATNPIIWLISLFVIAAIYAVFGLLFSGTMDYEMIFRVLAFSEVARSSYIINPIPLLRELIFFIHWLVLLTLGFKLVGQMATGKAILLAILPMLALIFLSCCCCCGFSLAFSAVLQP